MFYWLDTLRYDYPVRFRMLLALSCVLAGLVGLSLLSASPMLRAMGITDMQQRAAALTNALYWSTRAFFDSGSIDRPVILYGNMEGVDGAGRLIVTVASGTKWVRYHLSFADVQITDSDGVAQMVGELRLEDAKFEVYRRRQVVAWVRGVPCNVRFIEVGLARPDSDPPTNIVDVAFATYYWGIVRGAGIQFNQGIRL